MKMAKIQRATPAWHNTPVSFSKEKHFKRDSSQPFHFYPAYKIPYQMIWPWIMTSGPWKKWTPSSHPSNQVYDVVWSCSLQFGLYPAYKVSILSDATYMYNIDFWPWQKNRLFPLMLVIWWTKCVRLWSLRFGLYPAYKVSILSDATTFMFGHDKQQATFSSHSN
jgi:hypothetical protein